MTGMLLSVPFSAHAVISESEFLPQTEDAGALAAGPAPFFLPRRVLRTESTGSHVIMGLGAAGAAHSVHADAFDGSTILRKGNLGLDLANLSAGQGISIQERILSNLPASDRKELEQIISQALLSRLRSNPNLALKQGYFALDRSRTLLAADFSSLSFNLYVDGRRVDGTEITARFKDGAWISWTTDTFGAADGSAQLLESQVKVSLESVARQKLGPAFAKVTERENIWAPQRGANRYELVPAQQASLVDTTGQLYTLTVSEADGAVLEFYAHKYNFEGVISGSYYQRHPETPVVTTGLPYITVKTGGLFGRKTHTADKDGLLKVPLQRDVMVKLVSPFVAISNSAGKAAELKATGDASFEPGENSTLAETTTFFHTNVINDFVREHISQKLPWLDKQITATVNLSSTCNAFYNGTINFFTAGKRKRANGEELVCNNTGEIADVVYHEWGHGLDDNTGGIRDGAFSEAIGDITSLLITNSPEVGPYFIADGSPVRNLDGEYQYPPADDAREVHVEGLIFGSTWYHLTQDLISKYGEDVGRDTAARYFLKLVYTANKYTDAYQATLDIDSNRGENGPNFCLINGAFARHGLATADTACAAAL
jgi:hypothetical protein